MTARPLKILLLAGAALAFGVSACSKKQEAAPVAAAAPGYDVGYGPDPIPVGATPTLPGIKIAKGVGWKAGEAPAAAPGLAVARFAEGLVNPRWLYRLPNGDVLVAESNFTAGPGAGPNANRITLLRDADGDGIAELKTAFKEGLNQPLGMALKGGDLFIANTNAVLRFAYKDGDTKLKGAGKKILDLPSGGSNNHWTRNLLLKPDGSKLYVSVGSASNIAESGFDVEKGRAAIWEVNLDGSGERTFASGIRNPTGLDWNPQTGALWTVVNERDMLGDKLVPDYLTSVQDGGFYGWPYAYYKIIDSRVQPQDEELVARALKPDYGLGSHTASLGLTFYRGDSLPAKYKNGAFVGQHGSWNSSNFVGYKVLFVPFTDGKPSGPPQDILTGFLGEGGSDVRGRPVGVAEDKTGALLVADDFGGVIWRVTTANKS
jgi:glucose/arabinose dehydrogenase